MWFDPMLHKSIKVNSNINVNQNEAIIVYRQANDKKSKTQNDGSSTSTSTSTPVSTSGGDVTRTIMQGPMMYSPKGDEWFHHFKWNSNHGSSRGVSFTTLRLTEDYININIPSALTKDNISLKVKCVLYLKLLNIEQMLDATHDPIMIFINAINSDIVNTVSQFTFDELRLSENYSKFNNIDSGIFNTLNEQSKELGYKINKILFEGFEISNDLSDIFDKTTKIRIDNRVQREKEQETQKLKDYILDCEIKRHTKQLEMDKAQSKNSVEMKKIANQASLEHQENLYNMQIEYYKRLDEILDAQDMPKLAQLVKAEKEASKVESMQVVRIENNDATSERDVNLELGIHDDIKEKESTQNIRLDKVQTKAKNGTQKAKSKPN